MNSDEHYRRALLEYGSMLQTYGEAMRAGADDGNEFQVGFGEGMKTAGETLVRCSEWDSLERPATDQASFRGPFPRLAEMFPAGPSSVHAETGGILNDD